MKQYREDQINLLLKEGILNERIEKFILSSNDSIIKTYVSGLLHKKKVLLEIINQLNPKAIEFLRDIDKLRFKDINKLKNHKRIAENQVKSKKKWEKMKAFGSKEKNPILTQVSIKAISTNMKNQ